MRNADDLEKVATAMETMMGVLLPGSDVGPKFTALWRSAMSFAETIEDQVPEGEERESALTGIGEVLRLCSEGIMRDFDRGGGKVE